MLAEIARGDAEIRNALLYDPYLELADRHRLGYYKDGSAQVSESVLNRPYLHPGLVAGYGCERLISKAEAENP